MLHVRCSERFEYFHHGGLVFTETVLIFLVYLLLSSTIGTCNTIPYSTKARVGSGSQCSKPSIHATMWFLHRALG